MTNGTMPLPLGPSGAGQQIGNLTERYETNKVNRRQDWARYLQDQGVRKFDNKTGEMGLDNRARNPYGNFQQVRRVAEDSSAGQGFGFGGRTMDVQQQKPLYDLKKGLTDTFREKQLAEQSDRYELNKGTSEAFGEAANWGVKQKYFRVPTQAEVRANYGRSAF
jgi:hypothetical protein